MANTIKQKRGTTNPSASDLVVGELAINTTDGGVFTKTDGGTVVEVGTIAAGAVGSSELASTAVTAGTYGASQNGVPSFTVDADGRLTAASTDTSPSFSGAITCTSTSTSSFDGALFVDRTSSSHTCFVGAQNGTTTSSLSADGRAMFTGNVDLQDSDRLRLGTGDDLQIYHNGSSSLIQQTGTGNLFISNNVDDQDVVITCDDGSGGTTTYFRADGSSGEVKLYHYGTEKFNTKSDGVDITGELQCDSLDVDGSAAFSGTVSNSAAFVSDRSSGTSGAFVGRLNGTQTAEITADGSAILLAAVFLGIH